MEPTRILFITQEIFPYTPENFVSTICRELPQYAQDNGCEIRIFMPCFGNVNERRNQLHEVQRLSGLNLIINDTDHALIIKVASIQAARIQVYLIDNEDYFRRKAMDKDENGLSFEDNDERSIFYVRGVLETMRKLRWTPDIVHCHGWLTAIAPMLIKTAYHTDPFFKNSKIIYSIYDDIFENLLDKNFYKKLMLDGVKDSHVKALKATPTWETVTKLAIDFSDFVVEGEKGAKKNFEEYTKKKKVPFIPYDDDFRTNYYKIYRKISPLEEEED
ncbi:MAG: glycogen/starch synthase [Prevotellaceae bacterium]|jgi:starch synthase|nr:glycogen/starch synthase [Prevotellaceae bacterium]